MVYGSVSKNGDSAEDAHIRLITLILSETTRVGSYQLDRVQLKQQQPLTFFYEASPWSGAVVSSHPQNIS